MAGETTGTATNINNDVLKAALAALDNLGSGGGAGGYTNQVYLGTTPAKKVKGRGEYVSIPAGDRVMSINEAKALYLTDPATKSSWDSLLRKNGIVPDKIKARSLWDIAVSGASDWYSTSQGTQKVTPQQYLTWYLGSQKPAPEVPSRSIYEYSPEQLGAKIDEVAQSLLGRSITDADKTASWYQGLNKTLSDMAMQGSVTEPTKLVKNPKTGKMERVTIQRPEVTTEGMTQTITSALEKADPESLARKQRIDFTKWLYGQMGFRG